MLHLLWILLGALGIAAVALGAYGSHGAAFADDYARELFEIALGFHFFHLAPLGLAALIGSLKPAAAWRAGFAALALLAGLTLFSGSLYLRALAINVPGLATIDLPLAPAGGFALMAGWAGLAWAGLGCLKRT